MAKCMICGVNATDPEKGPSRWARAVVGGEQILVCPNCQQKHPEWIERAETCPECGSNRLIKSMGDRVCRACGNQWAPDGSDEDLKL